MNKVTDALWIRRLIWVYFFLLMFEGALRKWILPQLSDPLLIIRDPVAIAICVLAFRLRVFPRNYFMLFGGWLAFLTFAFALAAPMGSVSIWIYGWRTNFLHLPLIFIVGRVFTLEDVKRVGYWTMMLSIPMALLMVLQFRSGTDSFLNAGAGEGALQITSVTGRVRPSGLFSFISGPIYFFAMVAAFLFHGQLSQRQYPSWLTAAAMLSLFTATAVSGSRSLLAAVVIVVLFASFSGVVLQPMLVFRWLWSACVLGVVGAGLSELDFIREGLEVFTTRLSQAGSTEGGALGFANRGLGGFDIIYPMTAAPLLGYGLGMGTNVGAKLLTGDVAFLLAEGEYGRVIMESGPILGGAFLLWRACLAVWIGKAAGGWAMRGNALPWLLCGVCAPNILNGTWGQATTLGFGIFVGGLSLAAMRVRSEVGADVLQTAGPSGVPSLQGPQASRGWGPTHAPGGRARS